MTSPTPSPDALHDLVARAVLAFERDGESALVREFEAAGELQAEVRRQIEVLRAAGLLQEPELPEHIGPYRVLRRLGSGGMGSVYLCEQTAPVRRRVAVKVLRRGMDSADILSRFRLEQRALASLAHPGIAALLDAGATEGGRPYLVMEYVAGLPLHRFCDERQLDMRRRLELFAKVCDAVQHAHHKGILHRDIKPSNVLVADRDGAPWPIVIDFGLAKSIGSTFGDATLLTLPGAMIGTPEYMSPEQATHELDVDTRSDVYSLGVMLYELSTGTLPITRERLRGAAFARVLDSQDAPTPSSRVSTLGESAVAIAVSRRVDVPGLRRLLRGDLDWVTMKALEKDRNRRYGMPAELAADVRRYLANEPVSAGPVSSWYRLKKLCARNRVPAIATMAALVAVATGLVTSTWFWREAVASSRASAQSLDDALAAVGELVAVGDSDLVDVPHLAHVRRGLLERSIAFYQGFLARSDIGDPRLAPRVTDAQLRLGSLLVQLGEFDRALRELREADARAGQLPSEAVDFELRIRGLDALAEAEEHTADAAGAEATTRRAEGLLRAAFAAGQTDATRAALMRTLQRRAEYEQRVSVESALALASEAVQLGEPFAAAPDRHVQRMPRVLEVGAQQALLLLEVGRRDDAGRAIEELVARWQAARRSAPAANVDWRLTTAGGQIAALLARVDEHFKSLDLLTECAVAHERLVADHPGVLAYRTGLARARSHKAHAEMRCWRLVEGLATSRQAEQDYVDALAVAPDDPTLLHDAALAAIAVAEAHVQARLQSSPAADFEQARAARARAEQRIERLAQTVDGASTARRLRLEERRLYALLFEPAGSSQAREALGEAVRIADGLLRDDPASTPLRERRIELATRLGQNLRLDGQSRRAVEVLEEAAATQLTLRDGTTSLEIWEQRRRRLLVELVRAHADLGAFERVVGLVQEYLGLARHEDWVGRLDVVQLWLEFARGPLAARRSEALQQARDAVQLAIAAGTAFQQRERVGASPAMIAGMFARTHALHAEIEALAGDARAEADALGAVAECRAEASLASASERNRQLLREASAAWLDCLARAGDGARLAAAGRRIVAWSASDGEALLTAAAACGRFVAAAPDAAEVRAVGRQLVAAARAAGVAPAMLAGPDLQSLRVE